MARKSDDASTDASGEVSATPSIETGPIEGEVTPTTEGPAEAIGTDFARIGGSEGTSVESRISGLEDLFGRLTYFLSWLFPQHAVPGTDSEHAEGKTGPGAPPAPAGPVNPTPTPGVQATDTPQPFPPAV